MSYQLLTGATGLLGRYLVRDLLLADVPLAVLARASRKASVRQRVEQMMAFWERELEQSLPRPVVLEGDISQPDLGLDERSIGWVREFCTGMIHNAASLSFHSTGPESEPWRSNVQGVRNVLDLCEKADIFQFLHMSTAYVCGLREGVVRETELDVGQETGNDYEQSKIQAEKMVHAAEFIDDLTICRPAIIIGDSQTGYTSTYHGFYAALQLAHTLARAAGPDDTGWVRSIARLKLSGDDSKNLVPVDWVSAATTYILTHPELHGQTYHLTPRHPATARLIGDILEDAIHFYSAQFLGDQANIEDWTEAEEIFNDNIKVYDSYWRDDPKFDCTNTLTAMPHLPCPHVDREMLLRMSQVAIDCNFAGGRDKKVDLDFDAHQYLQSFHDANGADHQAGDQKLIGLRVLGGGGGDWHLKLSEGKLQSAGLGREVNCAAEFRLDADTFADLVHGRESTEAALQRGDLSIEGNGTPKSALMELFDELIRAEEPVRQ